MWNCKQDDRGWSVRSVPLSRPNVTLVGERREVKVHDGVFAAVRLQGWSSSLCRWSCRRGTCVAERVDGFGGIV